MIEHVSVCIPCPFCGTWPVFELFEGSYGNYPLTIVLKCQNLICAIQPRTKKYALEEWKQGEGTYKINPRLQMIKEWNTRT